jgi:hypothetical protein
MGVTLAIRICERIDGPDNGDWSKWIKLSFEHNGIVCKWRKTVRLYPTTKLPWYDLKRRSLEAYRDITGDLEGRPELSAEDIHKWFPELQ